MPYKIQVEGVRQKSPGQWMCETDPELLSIIPESVSPLPFPLEKTVIALYKTPLFDPQAGLLTFDPKFASQLGHGTSTEVVFSLLVANGMNIQPAATNSSDGDAHFIASLPCNLQPLGKSLLALVREFSKGRLKLAPNGRYIESPDNFWAVKIQPRVRSLRITVRGRPHQLSSSRIVKPKDDRPGYSTFTVSKIEEVAEAARIINSAKDL